MQLSFKKALRLRAAAVGACALAIAGVMQNGPAEAQSLFAPIITVNDAVITRFELEQRILFMKILRAPGDPEELARKALIDDRLRSQAISDAEITLTEEQVSEGLKNFASRTNLSVTDFLKALAEEGVAPETVRDFVRTNLGWRELVRGRFLNDARPSPTEIDRALGRDPSGSVRVLLSEIIIPATPQTIEQVEELANRISDLKTYAEFSEAAGQFSAADTRDQGGRLGWLAITNLPVPLQPVIMAMNPGDTSEPILLPNAVAVFQMRGMQEIVAPAARYSAIEYAEYRIPGGRSPEALARARDVRDRADTCNDLYGIAADQPPEVLDRKSEAPANIPRDVALELAKLDVGEVSTSLTRSNGETLVFLMLCGRTAALNQNATRDQIGEALAQQRLNTLSESFLDQLRAEALIIEQ